MAIDAVPLSVALPEPAALLEPAEALGIAAVGAITADASAVGLPVTPLAPVELAPVPSVGRLVRLAQAALGVLAHPYPRRTPRPPLTREEHLALASLETARLERERQAYRMGALAGSFR